MTEEEILIGNRIIAPFMGGYERDMGHGDIIWDHPHYMSPLVCKYDNDLKYHTSWEWIMPVWIKFRKIEAPIELEKSFSEWLSSLGWYLYSSDEPIRFFERLVYAIKWYNEQKK